MKLAPIFRHPTLQTVAISGGAIGASYLAFGGVGAGVAVILALLFAAIRHDNDFGTCFPLAVLLLIVAGVLIMLIFMLSLIGSR